MGLLEVFGAGGKALMLEADLLLAFSADYISLLFFLLHNPTLS